MSTPKRTENKELKKLLNEVGNAIINTQFISNTWQQASQEQKGLHKRICDIVRRAYKGNDS